MYIEKKIQKKIPHYILLPHHIPLSYYYQIPVLHIIHILYIYNIQAQETHNAFLMVDFDNIL